MYKKIKEVEQNYKIINKIINLARYNLTKKLLLNNIFTIVTRHDNLASNLFYNYLKKSTVVNKIENISSYKKNKSNIIEKSVRLVRHLWFGIRFILKPKKIWNIINVIDKNIILIYIPGLNYLDLAIPIYEEIKNSSDFTPVILYYCKDGKFCKNNYKQINLYDYSISLNRLFMILKEVIMTKKNINKEKKHQKFYNSIYRVIWKSQIINLINENIFRNLIKRTNKIKAIFYCLPHNFARISSLIAKDFNIPTFCIRRGVTNYAIGYNFINTKYILAKGEQEKAIYSKLGFNENTIKVVGAPFLKEKIISKPIMIEKIRVFYIDQPLGQYCSINCKRKIISYIGNALKNISNLKLLIKLHPISKDHEKIYKEEFQIIGFSNYVIYKSKYDLNKVLDISDYAIMHNSTVGFNVLLMNKPLIVLSNSFFEGDIGINEEQLFFDEKIAFTIRNEQDLKDIFMRISNGKLKRKNYKNIKRYLEYYVKYTGKRATVQIVKFIENKIQESEIGGTK